jgi:hypothetical protein
VPSIENTPSVNTRMKRAPSARACCQAALQVGHVVVGCSAVALGLAQADAVDDGRVVQRVADDGVLLAQQRLEQAAVGVEGGGVQDGVFGAEEARQPLLQRLVQVLRAADEAHAELRPKPWLSQRRLGGRHHRGVGRQAQVVVGAQVDQHHSSPAPTAWRVCASSAPSNWPVGSSGTS